MGEPGPSAGWYPDPAGGERMRYWNGRAWTTHVSPPDPDPVEEPATNPLPGSPPGPVAPTGAIAPPAATEPPPSSGPERPDARPTAPWLTLPPPTSANARPLPSGQRLGPDGQLLAGWWRRFAGYLIDGVLVTLVAVVLLLVVATLTGGFGSLVDSATWNDLLAKSEANPGYQPTEAEVRRLIGPGLLPFIGWLSVLSLALSFLNGVVLVAVGGQTIGDRVVGTRKVTAGRHVPGFGAAGLRWLIPAVLSGLQVVPLVGVVALAGWILDYLWPLWDPRSQALHDKAAHTYVERSALAGPVNR